CYSWFNGSPTLGFPVLLFPINKLDRDAFYGESQKRLGKIYLGIHTVYVGNIKAEAAYGLGRKPNLSHHSRA
ncbi:hypothetical protein, partial [Pseudoalteromonas sp. UBA6610]|uniref:hypothetical protein n=1 Tax=Pseudoalteromonas sp. UBA6610 TaxID=1947294 RepID=UPI002592CDF5